MESSSRASILQIDGDGKNQVGEFVEAESSLLIPMTPGVCRTTNGNKKAGI
jgi:hypothetical protein